MGFERRTSNYQNRKSVILFVVSLALVAFGQPARSPTIGLIAACIGYALFWLAALPLENAKKQARLGFFWFFCVQLIQLSWFLSHPYLYIISLWLFVSTLWGLQFALLTAFLTVNRILRLRTLLAFSALWTLFEWSRLFILSGFSWNPIGLALTGSLYALQTASFWGVFGLSFWVMFVNLLAVRATVLAEKKVAPWLLWAVCACLPYFYGMAHYHIHQKAMEAHNLSMTASLVQPSFGVEEAMHFDSKLSFLDHVHEEWKHLFSLLKEKRTTDLIVLPEFVVPFSAYSFAYPYDRAVALIESALGEKNLSFLPPKELPWAFFDGQSWKVNNVFFSQAIANYHKTGVVIGLEDVEDLEDKRVLYSAAFYFLPGNKDPKRYEKRVLVPMGEYIPFDWIKELAAGYGILNSFSPGKEAKVFTECKTPFTPSICYEETFGHVVKKGREMGGQLLVNLTSDAWYPDSSLPKQHLDHAILRTTEMGIPSLRACNTGITCAIDSLGQVIASLEEGGEFEKVSGVLHVTIPTYHYDTLYSYWGDHFIVSLSVVFLFWNGLFAFKKE